MKLSQIKKNPDNPRVIKDERFKKLVQSIEQFPKMMKLRPIVIDSNNVILGGNMRYEALKQLDFVEIPDEWVKRADELTEEEKQRFIIADNVGFGDWDFEALANDWDVDKLNDWGLELPEWEEEKLEVEEDDYEVPEVVHTDIVLGDLIEFECTDGRVHRLLCGDSTDSDAVAKLMNEQKADMVFTDPPYEIDFDYSNALLFAENAHVFIYNNDRALIRQLSTSPLEFKKFFVFNHSGCAIPQEGGNECFLDHILISHEVNGTPKVRFNKGDGLRTVIKGEYRRSENHKHEKPFSVIEPLIKSYTHPGFIVVDFFIGGGSNMIVSHQLKRICYGMELDPKYCQVIIDRMLKLDDAITVKINGKEYEKTTD